MTAGALDTPATLSDRVAADAPNLRTQLGLGTAALRADTDFPRFDADQSPTLIQKRTARFNLGNSDSFTTAELKALSASDSARLRQAWCSDCFTSGASTGQLVGDFCLWEGDRWVTFSDRVTPWADPDFPQWALEIARTAPLNNGPFLGVFGDFSSNAAGFPYFVSGSGANVFSSQTDLSRLVRWQATPGSTSSGVFRGVPVWGASGTTADPSRKLAVVLSYFGDTTSASSAGVDEWHWRFGIQPLAFSASAALQVDDIGFVMDDRNTLGQGASGANLRCMCRANGTTTHFTDSTIPVTTGAAHLVVTLEPVGAAATRSRIRLSTAGDFGASFTSPVDTTVTLSTANLQPVICGAKTLGTGSRIAIRRWLRFVCLRTSSGSGGTIS